MARAAKKNIPSVQADASRRTPVPKRHWRLAALGLVSVAALALPAPVHATTGVKEYAGPSTVNLVDWRDQGSGDSQQYDPWANGSAGNTTTAASEPATAAQTVGVVLIDTVLPYEQAKGAGTGMVLTASGQVLTNYHVVEGAGTITVTVASTGKRYPAKVVGSDETDDVALLQLTGASGLRTVHLDDEQAAVDDAVTAVGNAGGTGSLSAAKGRITSLAASVTTASEGPIASQTLRRMIETDADVVAGDSGGPLYDAEGEVVGIDTAASSGSEIDGYAIPIARAMAVVQQIRAGDETTKVRIGLAAFLGIEMTTDPVASGSPWGGQQNTAYGSGAGVGGVVEGLPAARAGLTEGDTITQVGSHTISSAADLSAVLATYDPGNRVKIAWVDSSGSRHTATVTLAASPVA
jgi:S1-C subfamily serine protease